MEEVGSILGVEGGTGGDQTHERRLVGVRPASVSHVMVRCAVYGVLLGFQDITATTSVSERTMTSEIAHNCALMGQRRLNNVSAAEIENIPIKTYQ